MTTLQFFLDEGSLIAHVGTLLPPVIALIGLIVWLVRLEAGVKDVRKDVEEMDKIIDGHVKDNAAHVNQLHIGNLERRIGALEISVRDIGKEMLAGNERISDKIDAKFDQIAARIK